MALDFPNNPTVNQQFPAPNGVTYVWDGTKWSVLAGAGGGGGGPGGSLIVGGGPPPSPAPAPSSLIASQTTAQGATYAGNFLAILGMNTYLDAAGGWHYVQNGPGAALTTHVGVPGQSYTFPHLTLAVEDVNTSGPGAPDATAPGAMQIVLGQPPGAPFVVVGRAADVPYPTYPMEGSIISNQVAVQASQALRNFSTVGLNMFRDAAGTAWCLRNGPVGSIEVSTGTAANPTSNIPHLSLNIFDINTAGPNTPATGGAGGLQLCYGDPAVIPGLPFVVIGTAAEAPTGPYPRRASLIAHDLIVRADPIDPSDRVSRIGLNGFQDNAPQATAAWHYLADGPAGTVTIHDANVGATPLPAASMRFAIADPGTANSNLVNAPRCVMFGPSGTNINQTNLMLTINSTGTPTLTQVEIGAPGSGGAGRRALVVPD